jgi:hypothetical protein
MNFGFLPSSSPGGGPPFEGHLAGLQEPAKGIMADLRRFALSLGPSVIEEVRPHRVVYAKTLTFRTFLDVEPAVDHLVVEIRTGGRQSPPERIIVKTQEEAERAKKAIAEAYEKIR